MRGNPSGRSNAPATAVPSENHYHGRWLALSAKRNAHTEILVPEALLRVHCRSHPSMYRSSGLQLRSDNHRGGSLQGLAADYTFHQFVIDRDEAEGSLFKNVASLVPAEQLLIALMGMLAGHPLGKRSFCAILSAGWQEKEESMDIKIRKRTKTIREIEIENMQETSEYMRLRTESMQEIRQSRPKGEREPFGPESPESIQAFLKKAFG